MQHEAGGGLVIHEVGGSPDAGVGELEILMQVVQSVQKVSHLSSKQSQHVPIAAKCRKHNTTY